MLGLPKNSIDIMKLEKSMTLPITMDSRLCIAHEEACQVCLIFGIAAKTRIIGTLYKGYQVFICGGLWKTIEKAG